MLWSRPSFLRKNVTPVKTGAGIQVSSPRSAECDLPPYATLVKTVEERRDLIAE